MSMEVYELQLAHYMTHGDERIRLEDPLVVRMVYDRRCGVPQSICLNSMLDRMKEEVLKRAGELE